MAKIGIGEGIALGNIATVDRSKPFTNAVLNRQKFDLAAQERRAKKTAEDAQQQKYLNSLLRFGEGGFSPFNQEEAQSIINNGLKTQMEHRNAGNQIGMMAAGAQMEKELDDLKVRDTTLKNFLTAKKEGYIVPKELEEGFMNARSAGEPKIQQFLKDNPQYSDVVQFNPETKGYSFNLIKQADLGKAYKEAITGLESNMTQSKYIRNIDNNTDLLELSAAPEQIKTTAVQMAVNPEFRANVRLSNPVEYKKVFNDIKTQHPEVPDEEVDLMAVSAINEKNLQTLNKKPYFSTKAIIRPEDSGGGYTINKKQFNPSLANPNQYLSSYVKAGVLTPQQADTYQNAVTNNPDLAKQLGKNLPDVLAIDPPNTGTFNLTDESGNPIKLDNVKMVYIPKTKTGGGQWFMSGITDQYGIQTPVDIPINERTYGNIISVYGKMSQNDIVKLLNKRMKDGGITNDKFVLDTKKPSLPHTKPSGKKKLPGT